MTSVAAPSDRPAVAEAGASPSPVAVTAHPVAPWRPSRREMIVAGIGATILIAAVVGGALLVTAHRAEAALHRGYKQAYAPFANRLKADTARLGADIAAADGGLQRGDFLELSSAFSAFRAKVGSLDFGSHRADAAQLASDSAALATDWRRAADSPVLAGSAQVQRDGAAWDAASTRLARDLGMSIDAQGNLTG